MKLGRTHKRKFKMRSTYTTKKRGRLMQVEWKWCNGFNRDNLKHKFTQLATFGRKHHSSSFSIFCAFMQGLHPNLIFPQDSQV
jgi:hypothetical protein